MKLSIASPYSFQVSAPRRCIALLRLSFARASRLSATIGAILVAKCLSRSPIGFSLNSSIKSPACAPANESGRLSGSGLAFPETKLTINLFARSASSSAAASRDLSVSTSSAPAVPGCPSASAPSELSVLSVPSLVAPSVAGLASSIGAVSVDIVSICCLLFDRFYTCMHASSNLKQRVKHPNATTGFTELIPNLALQQLLRRHLPQLLEVGLQRRPCRAVQRFQELQEGFLVQAVEPFHYQPPFQAFGAA